MGVGVLLQAAQVLGFGKQMFMPFGKSGATTHPVPQRSGSPAEVVELMETLAYRSQAQLEVLQRTIKHWPTLLWTAASQRAWSERDRRRSAQTPQGLWASVPSVASRATSNCSIFMIYLLQISLQTEKFKRLAERFYLFLEEYSVFCLNLRSFLFLLKLLLLDSPFIKFYWVVC